MNWLHIYPIKDKQYHSLAGLSCKCEPDIDWEDYIVIHHAFDMREIQEYINEKD